MPREKRLRLIVAFTSLYVIWGSTYLAMRIAIETIPPFLMAGTRFLIAGALLFAVARLTGSALPSRRQWFSASVIGTLLLLGGNGGVVWSEQFVASSIAALIVGAEPLWVVVIDWARPGGSKPTRAVVAGLITGFVGVALLIAPGRGDAGGVDPLSAAVLLAAIIAWAVGSIYSRNADTPGSPLMATGANMLAGSVGLLLAALATGELARFDLSAVSARSWGAWGYLIVFGAVCGFTAYIWLLKNTTLAAASTYAYVNPIVAVFLGWALGGETITTRTLVAAAVIIAGVVMISTLPHLRWFAARQAAVTGD